MSDELAPDAVGEPAAAPECFVEGCDQPGLYDGVCREHLDQRAPTVFAEADPSDEPEPTGEGSLDTTEGDGGAPPTPLAEGGDPGDFTVAEVAAYLESGIADAERVRILEAEAAGKGRKGILGE